jgi:uncharacterized protein YlaI
MQEQDRVQEELRTLQQGVRIKTIWDKLEYYEMTSDGKIKLPMIDETENKEKSKDKIFEDTESYMEWKDKKIKELKEEIFNRLTPMEYHITQNKGTERPFTGEYWDNNKVGMYVCKVCTQRLFSSTHKYNANAGHATFWNFLPFSINFNDDNLEFPSPTQAVYKLHFANSKPIKRISCSNVIYFN